MRQLARPLTYALFSLERPLVQMLVSAAVFLITEASPGNVARNVLGSFITPEQEASFLAQIVYGSPKDNRRQFAADDTGVVGVAIVV